jgi:hypothetical protein
LLVAAYQSEEEQLAFIENRPDEAQSGRWTLAGPHREVVALKVQETAYSLRL